MVGVQFAETDWTHIIVGGGSSGCVLANRLSERADNRVLVIEAGHDMLPGREPPEILSPAPAVIFHGTRYLWPGLRVMPFGRTERMRFYEQARVIGGGSSVNVQVANRGIPDDYDEWLRLGADGWDWNGVLPYFRKLERDLDYAGPLHGLTGPIPISRVRREAWPPISKQLAQALEESGLSDIEDQNGAFRDGYFAIAYSNEANARVSAAMAYLTEEVRRRTNLTIVTQAFVTKIVLDGRCAVGVDYERLGASHRATAREIVVSAGAIHTPALLMRAGIGPGQHLQAMGIEVVADRPGVGQNLREHPGTHICAYVNPAFRLDRTVRKSGHVAFRFSSGTEGYDVSDLYVNCGATAAWHGVGRRLAYFYLWLNKSHSQGEVTLRNLDPHAHPHIRLNLLADDRDVQRLCAGFRRLADIIRSPALDGVIHDPFPVRWSALIRAVNQVNRRNAAVMAGLGRMLDGAPSLRRTITRTFLANAPSLDTLLSSPDRLAGYLRANASSVWHPCGTCRMGASDDPKAVTDAAGQVHGIGGLRIVDASIMPVIPRANTNIPVIMAAEKISEAMLLRA